MPGVDASPDDEKAEYDGSHQPGSTANIKPGLIQKAVTTAQIEPDQENRNTKLAE
jgi:hypothetical protein